MSGERWVAGALLSLGLLWVSTLLRHPSLAGGTEGMFEAGGRSPDLPLAILLTSLSGGWLLSERVREARRLGRRGALVWAMSVLGASLAFSEIALRSLPRPLLRPHPRLFWELLPCPPARPDLVMLEPASPGPRLPGEIRILVLGDSTAWGAFPDQSLPWRFSRQLEELLLATSPGRKIRVFNGAVPGYSSFQVAEAFRLKFASFDPDVLIIGSNSDWVLDVAPDRDRLSPPWLQPLLLPLYRLETYLCIRDGVLRALPQGGLRGGQRRLGPSARVPPQESRSNLSSLAAWVQGRGGRVLLLDMPLNLGSGAGGWVWFRLEDLKAYRAVLVDLRRLPGVELVELHQEWQALPDRGASLFWDEVHPTVEGHRRVALRLEERLRAWLAALPGVR